MAGKLLIDTWIPEQPFNFGIPGGKFVCHYHLQLWTDHVLLDGWWYVRIGGKKVAENKHHVIFNEEFETLPVEWQEEWKLGNVGSAEASLRLEEHRANLKVKGEVAGKSFTLVDTVIKW